jgi:hypothetical protein
VAGVDVHHRERQTAWPERLQCQVQHDDGVLAAGEQQHRPLELGGDLADDVDRLGLEHPQMAQLVPGRLSEGFLRRRHHFPIKLVELTGLICIGDMEPVGGGCVNAGSRPDCAASRRRAAGSPTTSPTVDAIACG